MNKHCGLPVTFLGNSVCQFVQEVKYLSVIIHSTMKTTKDVARHLVNFTYKLTYCYEILDIALMM